MLTPNLRRGPEQWRSSSHSGPNGACVEVVGLSTSVAMRDSTYPTHSRLDFPRKEWAALIADIRGGRF